MPGGVSVISSMNTLFPGWSCNSTSASFTQATRFCRTWLKNDRMEITTATANKSIRAKWDETGRISVYFYPKGPAKCQVVVDHMKLESAAESKRLTKFWSESIDRLRTQFSDA